MAVPIVGLSPFKIGPLVPSTSSSGGGSKGFGQALTSSIDKLDQTQAVADQQTQALATGKATDVSSVVVAVEKASLEVQLATQIRTKATDAFTQIMQMQA
jgi:flagellar hook-basal body complex protein FliE